MPSRHVKKNLLDLTYMKYVQYANTVVILTFTYVIGVVVVFLTGQATFTELYDFTLLGFTSAAFLSVMIAVLLFLKIRMRDVTEKIKRF